MIARALATAAALVLMTTPAAAQHGEMPGKEAAATLFAMSVAPQHIDILTGDTVTWTNSSFLGHTVTSEAADWSSGTLNNADHFSHQFAGAGTFGYYCRFHPNIRGTVAAHGTLLEKPSGPAAPGRPFGLTGRTVLVAGTAITVEADIGAGYAPVASTQAQADGTFTARLATGAGGAYRVVAGGETSPAVQVVALDHTVTASVSGTRVRVRVTPAAPGLNVVLQLRLRERFGWWPTQSTRLNAASTATLTFRGSRRVRARIALTLPDGATVLATSPSFEARAPR